MMRERNKELDVLKSLGIFLMIFDHVGWGEVVHTYIQSFHMPLFFIVSGYLWVSDRNTKTIAYKRIKTVLVPYICFSFFYLLILICGSFLEINNASIVLAIRAILFFPTDMLNMPFAPALWFLPCFYVCNIIYAFLSEKLNEKKWIVIIALAIIGFFYSSVSTYRLPFALEPIMISPFFMLVGEYIKCNQKFLFSWLNKWWVLLGLTAFDVVSVFINGSCDLRSARYHNCILYVVNAILGTMICWGIIKKTLGLYTSNWTVLVYFSVYSISFLCANQFVILICERSLSFSINGNTLMVIVVKKIIVFIITIIICVFLNELIKRTKMKFIIGR